MKKEVKASRRADRFTVLRAINGSPAARRVSPLSPEASSSPLGAQATPPGNQAGLWYPSPTKNKGTCTLTYGSGPKAKGEGLSLPGGGGEEKGKQLVGADRAMKWWKQLLAFDFRVWHLLRHDGKEWGKDLGEECKLLKRSWMHGPGGWRETNCSLVKSCCSLWAAPAHLRERERVRSYCPFQQLTDLGMLRASPSVTKPSVCLVDQVATIYLCSAQPPHSFAPSWNGLPSLSLPGIFSPLITSPRLAFELGQGSDSICCCLFSPLLPRLGPNFISITKELEPGNAELRAIVLTMSPRESPDLIALSMSCSEPHANKQFPVKNEKPRFQSFQVKHYCF